MAFRVARAADGASTIGVQATVALPRETSSILIVFAQISDPVRIGLVTSLAEPGGNITGFATPENTIAAKSLELLRDTAPGRTRVAAIFDPGNPTHATRCRWRHAPLHEPTGANLGRRSRLLPAHR